MTATVDYKAEGGQSYEEPPGEAEEVQEVVEVSHANHGCDQRELRGERMNDSKSSVWSHVSHRQSEE